MSDLHIGDGLHKVLLAGIGALATGVEKGQEVVDSLVKKGELTVEQGKILNTELKRNRQNPPAPAPAPADSAPAPAAGAPRPATHVAPDSRRPDHEPLAAMPNRRSGSIPITSNDPIAGQQG
ncbi:hypothetical protein H3S93_02755 [Bifidobacterium sp. W8109]|uniref:phasin family protein n=1 Tax=Bifidobacterium asteroides TaxID=1684 RepID=UPI0018DE4394|nr:MULTISPECIES: hypothetical protein [Bifidobacterium]MBH9971235.1 hypothetical protein [Bifidobacterium asteroides]MBI0072442.1 hypothetical protein [Bifidobacterium sp. W8110]